MLVDADRPLQVEMQQIIPLRKLRQEGRFLVLFICGLEYPQEVEFVQFPDNLTG